MEIGALEDFSVLPSAYEVEQSKKCSWRGQDGGAEERGGEAAPRGRLWWQLFISNTTEWSDQHTHFASTHPMAGQGLGDRDPSHAEELRMRCVPLETEGTPPCWKWEEDKTEFRYLLFTLPLLFLLLQNPWQFPALCGCQVHTLALCLFSWHWANICDALIQDRVFTLQRFGLRRRTGT